MRKNDVAGIVTRRISARLDRPLEDLTPDARFAEDLRTDPLELTELIMALQEEFGIVAECEVTEIQTVADAIRYVEARIYD